MSCRPLSNSSRGKQGVIYRGSLGVLAEAEEGGPSPLGGILAHPQGPRPLAREGRGQPDGLWEQGPGSARTLRDGTTSALPLTHVFAEVSFEF